MQFGLTLTELAFSLQSFWIPPPPKCKLREKGICHMPRESLHVCLWIARQPFLSLAFPFPLAALAHDTLYAQLFIINIV